MEKTKKKILGLLGLLLVAAVTVFAAFLPGPEAMATGSVTDTVQIRVVGDKPNVDIVSDLKTDEVVTTPKHDVTINYENLNHIEATLTFTDKDGNKHSVPLLNEDLDYEAGSRTLSFDFLEGDYDYGDYVLTVKGTGVDGVSDTTTLKFSFVPVEASITEDGDTGDPIVDLDYDPDEGGPEDDGKIKEIKITILDEKGNPIEISPIIVQAPTKEVKMPFDELGLPSGKYTIEIEAYDRHGNSLYKKISYVYYYKTIPVPGTGGDDTKTPDTGGLLGSLNVSKSDYLTTGLMIFAIVGIGGTIYIIKHDKKTRK